MALLLLLLPALLHPTSVRADPQSDLALIASRKLHALWPSTPSALAAAAKSASALAESLLPSGLWADINYTQQDRANWDAANHFARVNTMVVGLTAPGSPVLDQPLLTQRTHLAMAAWFKPKPRTNPNW